MNAGDLVLRRGRGQLAELHLHFEGSLDVGVLNRLGRRLGLADLPPGSLRISGWDDGERAFGAVLARLRDAGGYADAVRAVRARLVREGICYAEMSVMPVIHVGLGVAFAELWRGMAEGLAEGLAEGGPCLRVLFAVPRNAGAAAGFETLRLIEQAGHAGIVGIDLAGTEAEGTIAPFAPVFDAARAMGLRTAAHAGEFGPAARVRETLRLLRPDRIGHGLAAVDDADVLAELSDSGVPVDLSPRGNVAFGAVTSLAAHPLRRLFEAGVPITISTDDPVLVGTTLSAELDLLEDEFGLSAAEAAGVAGNGLRYAFALPDRVAA